MPYATHDPDTSARPHKQRRRWGWGRWLALTVVLLLLAAVAGHSLWGTAARGKLDMLLAELRDAGEPVSPDDLQPKTPIPDARNAVVELRAAARSLDATRAEWTRLAKMEALALPLTEREAAVVGSLVAAEQGALDQLARAAAKPEVDWQLQLGSPLVATLLPDLNEQRQLVNLVAAAALLAQQQGDDALAVERLRQILFISRAVDQQPWLIAHLVSLGSAAVAAQHAAEIAPVLRLAADREGDSADRRTPAPAGGGEVAASREQVRALITELLDEASPREGLRRSWQGERVTIVDAADHVVAGGAKFGPAPAAGTGLGQRLKGYAMKPIVLTDARLMAEHMTALIAAVDAPDAAAYLAALPPLPPELSGPSALHVLAAGLMPSYERSVELHHRGLTERRLGAAALAARLYAADHCGDLPADLQDLVPAYLPSVPVDGLAAGARPVRYANAAGGPVVYAVGPNGTDEGGSEAEIKITRADGSTYAAPEDMVFHLTRQPRIVEPVDEEEGEEADAEDSGVPPDGAAVDGDEGGAAAEGLGPEQDTSTEPPSVP